MNKRHAITLAEIFAKPPLRTMRWADIEALFKAVGKVEEREGSRIVVEVNSETYHAHRPHPSPEVGRRTIKQVALFLERAGIRPV